MANPDIEKLARNITDSEKEAIKNIDSQIIKERVGNIDLVTAARKMREMGLGDAADKLSGMSNEDLINVISKNPQVIDKLKKIFR